MMSYKVGLHKFLLEKFMEVAFQIYRQPPYKEALAQAI